MIDRRRLLGAAAGLPALAATARGQERHPSRNIPMILPHTPDGYTLLMGLPVIAVLPEADRLFGRTPAYEVSQLQPVARILADPALLAVPGSASWKTAQE